MANQIERDAWVKQDKLKNPIPYVRGTDLLPIVFHFRDFTIPGSATARVFVAKPDGNAVYDTATIEGNDVTVDVTEQMFLVLGMTLMQISIFDGEEELVSFAQPVIVEPNLKAGDFPESVTDVKALDEAIEQANQAVETATAVASQAAQAVQNANAAISDANQAIADLNEQIASMNTNFSSLANSVNIPQLHTTAKTLVGGINEIGGNATQGDVMAVFNEIKDNLWKTWDTGLINTLVSISGPSLYVLGYKVSNDYGSIMIMSYFANRPAYVYVNNGIWYAPVNI